MTKSVLDSLNFSRYPLVDIRLISLPGDRKLVIWVKERLTSPSLKNPSPPGFRDRWIMSERTSEQVTANRLDAKLFIITETARELGDRGSKEWADLYYRLNNVRWKLRRIMHQDDRKGTEG